MKCPNCKSENPESKTYCGDCGEPIEMRLRLTVKREVQQAVNARFKRRDLVVSEIAHAVTDKVLRWAKLYGVLVGVPLTLALALHGVTLYTALPKLQTANEKADELLRRLEVATTEGIEASDHIRSLRDQARSLPNDLSTAVDAVVKTAAGDQKKVENLRNLVRKADELIEEQWELIEDQDKDIVELRNLLNLDRK